jgi:hypothetical protein
MKKKLVPIQFAPNLVEMLHDWKAALTDENVGWCLLCDGPIRSARDLIPKTNTHNCPEGRRLELRGGRPCISG